MALAPGNKILYIPPPTGGINGIDPYSNMPITDAVALVNIAPKESYSEVRKGFEILATSGATVGISTAKWKLTPFIASAGTGVFLAQGFDLGYVVSPSWSASFALSSNMNFCQFKTFLFGAGGGVATKKFDGTTTLIATAWTGTGLTETNLESPWVYKGRLFFCEANSRNTWYADIDQVAGAAKALTKFPLDSQFHRGGYGLFGGSTVPEEGKDTESFWTCVSDQGEVLVYTGQDPGSSDWNFYGRYYIPPPLARNSFFYLGGVLHIQTRMGIYSLNDVISGKKEGSRYFSISKKIDPILSQIYPKQTDSQFYQAAVSIKENLLYIRADVPSVGDVAFVMNLTTGVWSQYRINNSSGPTLSFLSGFSAIGEDVYFITQGPAGDAKVSLWWTGQELFYDRWGTSADKKDIKWSIQHAFVNGNQNINKKFNKVRPILKQQTSLDIGSYGDFDTSLSIQSVTTGLSMNKKFYDINTEAFYLSLYLSGDSNDSGATDLPQYHGSLLSYQPGSDVP